MRVCSGVIVLLVVHGISGCAGSPSTPSIAALSTGSTSASAVIPTVRSLSPNVGSTAGATQVKIDGAGLGTTVTFGGVPVQGRFFSGNPTMYLSTPPHAAGTVEVVVSGQGSESVTLTNAFTFASPLAFNVDGDWVGFGQTDLDGDVSFTIRNNLLLTVSCGTDVVTFSPPRPVTNGEFSFVGEDGVSFSGRIVAVSETIGTIKLGRCESSEWRARKQ